MMLSFIWCFVMNHADVWNWGGVLVTNAGIMAAGVFGFIGWRLRSEVRGKVARQQAAAFLIW
jgi:hypothetical protein